VPGGAPSRWGEVVGPMKLRHMSYEVLPALSIRKAELRRSLHLVTAAWGFGIIWMTCISGSWLNSFRRMLGFSDRHFGWMQSLPFLAMLANLAGTVLIERTGLRKYHFIVSVGIARMLWLVVAVLLVLLGGQPIAIWLVLGTLLVSWTLSAFGMPAWYSWMGDLIPRRIRGRYLATRQRITRLLQFPVAITLAIIFDQVTDSSRAFTPQGQPLLMWALAGVFVLAAVFGLIDILIFFRIRDLRPPIREGAGGPAVEIAVRTPRAGGPIGTASHGVRYLFAAADELLVGPLKDRVFRRYAIYGATVTFAMAVGGPFYIRNMRENLGFSHLALNVMFMVLGPIVSILAVKHWGRLMDRWGRRPALMASTALATFGVAPYFLASRQTPNPQFVSDGINAAAGGVGWLVAWLAGAVGISIDAGGWELIPPGAPVGAWLVCSTTVFFGFIGWSGVMMGQQGIILGFSDGAGRSKYVAAHAVMTGLGGVAGGIVGGYVAEWIVTASWYAPIRLGAFEWNNWHATFALSMLARMTAFCLLIGMPDPGARRARDMVRAVGIEMYNVVAARLFYPWRVLLRTRSRRRPRPPGPSSDE
jgi:MFS family permease